MSLSIDYEKTASHISDYIENGKLFDVFEIEDIEQIMNYSKLTTEQYITLLKDSPSTIDASKIYICTRKCTVSIQNYDEVVSILNSVRKYMKLKILDDILDVLNQQEKQMHDCREENIKLRKEIKLLQIKVQSAVKKRTVKQINENNIQSRVILAKIAKLKKSGDFESVYKFLDELSEKENKEMMSKACVEGLWEKTKQYGSNILHYACGRGNLRLVKSLIECNCNKESKDSYKSTPLIIASSQGHLEVVQYLISVGANKDAKNDDGYTPLIHASFNGHLAVVRYLISVGANKDAKDNYGRTPLSHAESEVRRYLESIGAK